MEYVEKEKLMDALRGTFPSGWGKDEAWSSKKVISAIEETGGVERDEIASGRELLSAIRLMDKCIAHEKEMLGLYTEDANTESEKWDYETLTGLMFETERNLNGFKIAAALLEREFNQFYD